MFVHYTLLNMTNNYDKIFIKYKKTHAKPDKQYSMLPTILKLSSPLENKVVVDVGCGDGFFSSEFAKKAKIIYGLDNSKKQITEASKESPKNIKYSVSDMLEFPYPKSDLVNIPFVIGYLKSNDLILKLLKRIHSSLNKDGKIVGIIDSPQSIYHDNKKFGSIKKLESLTDGANLTIDLYDNKKIVTLNTFYYTPKTIRKLLSLAGFKKITWHKPIVSKQGLDTFGKTFWQEYLRNIDIKYFTSTK